MSTKTIFLGVRFILKKETQPDTYMLSIIFPTKITLYYVVILKRHAYLFHHEYLSLIIHVRNVETTTNFPFLKYNVRASE